MANEDKRATLLARLQTAIELEWSTIPPYMVAILSMKLTANREAANLIRGVMMEEMLHMALVANVLNAVGGTVHIGPDNVPSYPLRLFKGRDFPVDLAPFSAETVDDVHEDRGARDERRRVLPEHRGPARGAGRRAGRSSRAIPRASCRTTTTGAPATRSSRSADLDSAKKALGIVIDKGEGAGQQPSIHARRPAADGALLPLRGDPLPAPLPSERRSRETAHRRARCRSTISRFIRSRSIRRAADYAPRLQTGEAERRVQLPLHDDAPAAPAGAHRQPKVLYTAIMNGMHGSTSGGAGHDDHADPGRP